MHPQYPSDRYAYLAKRDPPKQRYVAGGENEIYSRHCICINYGRCTTTRIMLIPHHESINEFKFITKMWVREERCWFWDGNGTLTSPRIVWGGGGRLPVKQPTGYTACIHKFILHTRAPSSRYTPATVNALPSSYARNDLINYKWGTPFSAAHIAAKVMLNKSTNVRCYPRNFLQNRCKYLGRCA